MGRIYKVSIALTAAESENLNQVQVGKDNQLRSSFFPKQLVDLYLSIVKKKKKKNTAQCHQINMRGLFFFLAVIPAAVLACTNPDTDPCASYMSANGASASAFCATFTQSTVTATTGLPSWASNCSNKPSALSKECSCYVTGTAATATATTTTSSSSKATTTATSTKTSTGATTTATNSCGAAAINGLVGYASGTTGGGSGSGTTVTSCSALEAAVANGGVIQISGVLDGCDIIDLGSDTTVLGVGSQSGKYNTLFT